MKYQLEILFPKKDLAWLDWDAKLKKIGCTLRWKDLQKKYADKLELYQDVVPCLEKLKHKFGLFIVTDGYDCGQRIRIEAANLTQYFEKIFYSNTFGKIKSDEDYFPTLLKQLGLKGTEVAFIDDSEKCILSAKKEGIKTIRLCRGKKQNSKADYIIKSLEELTKILGE